MDIFMAAEDATAVVFAYDFGSRFTERLARARNLGKWASRAMTACNEDQTRYQDILFRIALSTNDDRVLVDRVWGDLAAAEVHITRDRVRDIMKLCVD